MGSWTRFAIVILVLAVAFFVVAALVMVTWNATIQHLVKSVDGAYYDGGAHGGGFTDINYLHAMTFTLFIGLLWGAPAIQTTIDLERRWFMKGRKGKKDGY